MGDASVSDGNAGEGSRGDGSRGDAAARHWPVIARAEAHPRWRDFVTMAFALVWETDSSGTLVFVAPDNALGWHADALLGCVGADLLMPMPGGFDPFAPGASFRNRRVWLRAADGGAVCLSVTAAPIIAGGICVGMRGVGLPVVARDREKAKVAAALRRGEVVERILWQMRQEVLAPRMMQAVLEGLNAALDAAGTVVVDLLAKPGAEIVLHGTGAEAGPLVAGLYAALQSDGDEAVTGSIAGHPTLTCPTFTRFGERAGLCVWREAGAAPWTEDDALLASAVTTLVRIVLEHEAIQRELAKQARTDPLTGLLNRRSFVEEITRRLDRLDREGLPGTLMYVDLDHFKRLNDGCGHDVGDCALVAVGVLLRTAVRPSDVVARLGGDEFAMWLDGSDELAAAERAEQLRLDAPALLAAELPASAPALSASVGIAARHPHLAETLEDVMRRADSAMYEAKRAGRAQWRVSQPPRY